MAILIDGYNLLNATGVEGVGRGTELHRARQGLLGFLSEKLTGEELAGTTIVFDAQGAPPGLPNRESFSGITVLYSKGYAEADDLLEELIAADHSPRNLLVVSSDHRLHRAARRRKATPVDSNVWISQLEQRAGQSADSKPTPTAPPVPENSDSWLAEFADIDVTEIEQELQQEQSRSGNNDQAAEDSNAAGESSDQSAEDETADERAGEDTIFPADFGRELDEAAELLDADDWNPFPPGYAEDLLDEFDENG